jgi:hypothetical protein
MNLLSILIWLYGQITTLATTVAQKFNQERGRNEDTYLKKVDTAADSTRLGGKTYNEISAETNTAVGAGVASANAATDTKIAQVNVAVANVQQNESEHYAELLGRIGNVQTMAETPIKAILQIDTLPNADDNLSTLFQATMAAQNKAIVKGQYKIEFVADSTNTVRVPLASGTVSKEITAGDSILFDVTDTQGTIANATFSNDIVSGRLVGIETALLDMQNVMTGTPVDQIFAAALTV